MASLEQIRSSNTQITEASVPKTSVFVGGTDGIGKATLVNLVSRGFPIKVYIVGRNKNGHRGLLNELSKLNLSAILVYVEGQISLLGETSRIVNQIASQEDKVDLLFLSAGYLPFNGREESSEGLEKSQVVCYYSHILFITRLLSQLRNASTPSQPARVVNILAAGQETTNIFLDDLTLKEAGHFNIPNFAGHAATSMTLTLKKIAEAPENKNVVFIHAHPGRVSTNLMTKSLGNKLDPSQLPSGPGGTFVQLTPEEAGDRCIYLITSAEFGEKGVRIPSERKAGQTLVHTLDGSLFTVSDKMEIVQQDELLGNLEKMGASQKIWDHTFDFLNSLS